MAFMINCQHINYTEGNNTMRTNFEPTTKRNNVINEHGAEWQERKDRMKKRHKTQRGNSEKRNWKEAL